MKNGYRLKIWKNLNPEKEEEVSPCEIIEINMDETPTANPLKELIGKADSLYYLDENVSQVEVSKIKDGSESRMMFMRVLADGSDTEYTDEYKVEMEADPLYKALEAYSSGDENVLEEYIGGEMLFGNEVREYIEGLPREEDREYVNIDEDDLENIKERALVTHIEDRFMNGHANDAVKLMVEYDIPVSKLNMDNVGHERTLEEFREQWLRNNLEDTRIEIAEEERQKDIENALKNPLESTTYTLPVHWLSYLVNDDASGIEQKEKEEIDAFIQREMETNGYAHFTATPPSEGAEQYFKPYNDANSLGADVIDFDFLHKKGTPPKVENKKEYSLRIWNDDSAETPILITEVIGDRNELINEAKEKSEYNDEYRAEVRHTPKDVNFEDGELVYSYSVEGEEKPYMKEIESSFLYQALEQYQRGNEEYLVAEISNEARYGTEIEDFIASLPLEEDREYIEIDQDELDNLQDRAMINSVEELFILSQNRGLRMMVEYDIPVHRINPNNIGLTQDVDDFQKEWIENKVEDHRLEKNNKENSLKQKGMKR